MVPCTVRGRLVDITTEERRGKMTLIRSRWTIAIAAFVMGALLVIGGTAIATGEDTFYACEQNGTVIPGTIKVGEEPT